MVQKFGKFGVRSGNSFKASNSKYLRRYRRDALVFRESINCSDINTTSTDFLEQTDVTDDQVPYSLNKKGRWGLPETLKRAILLGEFRREEYGVQMVELHKVNKPANCVAVYASKGPVGKLAIQKKKGKRHRRGTGYMPAKSIVNAKPGGISKRKQKQLERQGLNPDDENTEAINEQSQIRFEVVCPSPVTSSVTHNPKYIGHDTTLRKQKNCQRKHRRKHCDHFLYEDSLDMESQFEESEDEDCFHDDDFLHREMEGENIVLSDFMHQRGQTRTNRTKRVKSLGSDSVNTISNERKSKLFYCVDTPQESPNEAESEEREPHIQSEKPRTLSVTPVLVFLPSHDALPHTLKNKYADDYIECDCSPRKFIIDISDRLINTKMLPTHWKVCPDRINATVTFVFDVYNECNNVTEQVYKVYANATFDNQITSIKIETLSDYMETTVDECLTRSVFFLETIASNLEVNKTQTVYGKTQTGISITKSVSYVPNDCFVLRALFEKSKALPGKISTTHLQTNDQCNGAFRQDDIFCGICYDVICLSDSSSTALSACGHWFCDNCWIEYLQTQVRHGATKLHCPEFDCDTPLDLGTLMSLLNMKDIIRYARNCHDTNVEQLEAAKWCPNEKCGRIVQVKSQTVETVSCGCGQTWCFKCDGKKHWPASCDDAKSYHAKLRELGLEEGESDDLVISFVNGRHCPHCNRFVEKNGGCTEVICICRNSFCWGCGKPYESTFHLYCYLKGSRDIHVRTVKRRLFVKDRIEDFNVDLTNELFDVAVHHRLEQGADRTRGLKTAAKDFGKKLQAYIIRSKEKGTTVDIAEENIHGDGKGASDFLTDIISLYSEMNNLAEYTAVLLLSSTTSNRDLSKFLRHMLNRFNILCATIRHTVVHNRECSSKEIIVRLKDARFHSIKDIKALRSKLRKAQLEMN